MTQVQDSYGLVFVVIVVVLLLLWNGGELLFAVDNDRYYFSDQVQLQDTCMYLHDPRVIASYTHIRSLVR